MELEDLFSYTQDSAIIFCPGPDESNSYISTLLH
jgi:hypothetical protein